MQGLKKKAVLKDYLMPVLYSSLREEKGSSPREKPELAP